ncbi:MAG: DUF2336 domain-containing protein [Hyphomonadaceae bacterium]
MSIVTMRATLTDSDIRTLVKGVAEEDRAQAAHKICRCIDDAEISDEERAHAEEILRVMANDAAVLVRRALAVALKNSAKLPRAVAVKLAQDIDSVALPVILNSPSLTDADLVEIVCASPPSKQMAVASREKLSSIVTGAIAEFSPAPVLERALANDNALFDAHGLEAAMDRFAGVSSIMGAMVRRQVLPVTVTEKLVSIVTGELFDELVNNHELPPQLAIELAIGARERATLDIIEQAAHQSDLPGFVAQLHLHGRLTPSLLMRALCMGQIAFVEHAMAELAGITHQRAWLMIHDSGPLGLKAIFDRAGLPPRLYAPFRASIDIYHQMEHEDGVIGGARFRARMLERSLTLFQCIPKDDLDYLLDKLDAIGAKPELAAALEV